MQIPTDEAGAPVTVSDFLSGQSAGQRVLIAETDGGGADGSVARAVAAIALTHDIDTMPLLTSFDLSAHDGLMLAERFDALCGEAEAAVRAEHAAAAEQAHARRVVRAQPTRSGRAPASGSSMGTCVAAGVCVACAGDVLGNALVIAAWQRTIVIALSRLAPRVTPRMTRFVCTTCYTRKHLHPGCSAGAPLSPASCVQEAARAEAAAAAERVAAVRAAQAAVAGIAGAALVFDADFAKEPVEDEDSPSTVADSATETKLETSAGVPYITPAPPTATELSARFLELASAAGDDGAPPTNAAAVTMLTVTAGSTAASAPALFRAAFAAEPGVDWLVATLPHDEPVPAPLCLYFDRVPRVPGSSFPHQLFLLHRCGPAAVRP